LRHTIAMSTSGGVWEWGRMVRQPL
jgi:hypothetical protein